ncbi:MAG TPA: rRNA adenine N-6-methyltransferase family protein [Terriglobales bacterium]|nr:rRNA adenine N-6-methyltransferase family protein [Terriglobales bacterium]
MTLEECRRFYAEEIRLAGSVKSTALVEAFARVPREKFLGPGPWHFRSMDLALGECAYLRSEDADPRHVYHNVPIALDAARDLNNGQPGTLARWIDDLDVRPGDRVYHLGCGVGYYTAILAEVVGAGGDLVASEVDEQLAARARENLASYPNVTVHHGDGAVLDPGECDAMLINAGVTHPHPGWLERLRKGGRLLLPLTVPLAPNVGKGMMVKITRLVAGYAAQVVTFVAIYSCSSVRDSQVEVLLGKAMASGALFQLKSVRRDPHTACDSCLVHAGNLCLSSVAAALPVPQVSSQTLG